MAHPRVRPAHTGEPAHTKPERASAAHLEADSEEHDHPHKLSWRDFNRVIFVAAAAGAIWFARESAIPYLNSIGAVMRSGRRLSDLPRSVRKYRRSAA